MVRNKLHICKEYHVQPSEIDSIPWYEYEFIIEDINKDNEESKKDNDSIDAKSIMRDAKNSMPKMPRTPKMPKF